MDDDDEGAGDTNAALFRRRRLVDFMVLAAAAAAAASVELALVVDTAYRVLLSLLYIYSFKLLLMSAVFVFCSLRHGRLTRMFTGAFDRVRMCHISIAGANIIFLSKTKTIEKAIINYHCRQ
jgi:hypothetical protein